MIQFDKTTIVRMIYCIGVLAVGKLVTYIEYKYFATINLIKKNSSCRMREQSTRAAMQGVA